MFKCNENSKRIERIGVMKKSISENEQSFRYWMSKQFTKEGVRRFTDTAIIAYATALRSAGHHLEPYVPGNLFEISDPLDLEEVYDKIYASPDFDRLNEESGNDTLRVSMQFYQALITHGMQSEAPDISAAFYLKGNTSNEEYSEHRGVEFRYEEVPMVPIQKIFFGVPGTGKSYTINKMLESFYPDRAERDDHCRRVIFHPTYSYEDFIGSIKPLATPDHPLDYVFTAGPFSYVLKEAFLHPAETYYLIIEEINRGNAPAIFGDLFQLLDRAPSGKSMYAVQNDNITTYFSRDPWLKNLFYEGMIWLPANFNILATMNTADENIFVLDNAFKRRFALEYMPILFDNIPSDWNESYGIFGGTTPLDSLFHNTPLGNYTIQLARDGDLSRDWPTFARLTNKIIDMQNTQRINSGQTKLSRIPENKKLGPFFVSKEELCNRETFINKVLFYLKQDVFSNSDHYMTESFEEIYVKCIDPSFDLFSLLC